MNEIEQAVREELGKIIKIDIATISSDDNVAEVAELDSLSILELLGMIEERFNIVIPPDKVPEMNTIKNIVEIIENCK